MKILIEIRADIKDEAVEDIRTELPQLLANKIQDDINKRALLLVDEESFQSFDIYVQEETPQKKEAHSYNISTTSLAKEDSP